MLVDKEDAKELIDESDIEVQRVYVVRCAKCNNELTIIKDNEQEIKDYLIDELDWNFNSDIDETDGSEVNELICPDCKLLV